MFFICFSSGYSAWLAEYQYNDELDQVFKACNLVSGMFQRLDKLHKNGFASVCVFSEDKRIEIGGLWIFRGQNLAFSVSTLLVMHVSFDLLSSRFYSILPSIANEKPMIQDDINKL